MTDDAISPRERLRALPKADLHCHLDGSLRPATMLALAAEQGLTLPRQDAESLGRYMVASDTHSLEEYLTRFAVTLSVMQTEASLERIAAELVADAADDGVRYLEARFAPSLCTRGGLEPGAVVEAVLRGLARGEHEHATVARAIICALRQESADASLEASRLAVSYRDRGVVGFDLAGPEHGHPASGHARAFEHARVHGLACTCHAGEGDGAASIWDAIERCGAHRIGHATHLIDDPRLVDYAGERNLPLEVCLTSNVQTAAVASLPEHPAREYLRLGLTVVLNTDNRLMSGVTLTDEYMHASETLGLSAEELARVARNGFASAFLPETERRALTESTRAGIDAFTRGAPTPNRQG